MRIFVDVCIWQVTRDFVRQLGHDIVTAEDRALASAEDEEVLAQAVSEDRVFLTRDMDFTNILLYPPTRFPGIVVLKIKPETIDVVHRTLASALSHFTQESIRQALVIVDRNKFRERR